MKKKHTNSLKRKVQQKKRANLHVFNGFNSSNLLNPLLISKQNLANISRLHITQMDGMNRVLYHHIVKPKTAHCQTWNTHILLFITRALEIPVQGGVEILNDPEFPIRVGRDPEYFGCALVLVADAERA